MPPRLLPALLLRPLLLLPTLACPAIAQEEIGPQAPMTPEAASALEAFIAREVDRKEIPALSIALVAGDRIVWARGFGSADPESGTPATAETVYRVGSVSKLFTDIAAMQLVEQGQLDLDAPIADAIPGLAIPGPFDEPITLRHLMSHRAGIVREPPVGHYFDPSGPTLADTVLSLNNTTRLLPPGAKTKYSNAGLGAVGLAVELASGRPFAEVVRSGILRPLGMDSSDFEPSPELEGKLPQAIMWSYDGRTFPAPRFPLGYAPAGSLVASMPDLGRFLIALFHDGQGPNGPILQPETLDRMLEPQFDDDGRFGLGFAVGSWQGRRRFGHGGAVYGFATELAALPDEQLGVAVSASRDCADVDRIAELALETLLALQEGEPLPRFPRSEPLPDGLARALRGRFADEDDPGRVVELLDIDGLLLLVPPQGGFLTELRCPADGPDNALVVDGPLVSHGPTITFSDDRNALTLGGDTFRRLPDDQPPPPAPDEWLGLIGAYGWDHNVLEILEREGRLYALIEWFFLDPLEPVTGQTDTFAFPNSSLYHDETIAFERSPSGRASRALLAGSVVFERRPIAGEDGSTFRVVPLRPVSELLPGALAAAPPTEPGPFREPELVDLTALDPTIRLDIRYATDTNFLGTPFYSSPRALMQRPAAEALVRAHQELEPDGLGLLIHDAYRPWYVTKMFYDATPPESRGFVAHPALGSKHNRGCAVDLTLCDRATGAPVPMVAGYDEFSDRAGAFYLGGTSRRRWYRSRLRQAMEDQGFTVIDNEWWHFDYKDWPSYPIGNLPFEAINAEAP
ncbi:serine hydrolase [Tautonia sociabilis]|uniref:D-alanyl-D-alanine dipeptidase n=1 Tax=Tautonia sociabilis TaxID=2080755 RepID=A0A432MIL9_9BACT|nr:serine hydrolase [Tautonia sociabilis]RUL87070.1 serine hydrolase [Tautonia sociabilis]